MQPHRGTLILVLGILSLVLCGFVTGIPAWIMGNGDMKKIRNGEMDPTGESLTNIGRILGIVGTILYVALFCIWIIVVVFFFGVAGLMVQKQG